MRKATRFVAVLMAAAMVLGGCGGGSGSGGSGGGGEGEITDLVTYETGSREMENLIMQHTERAEDHNVLCNTTGSLLETDSKGQLVPGLASEWETEDEGLTWTFHLREGVKWADQNGNEKGEITSQDFITGLEWVLNAKKNEALNTSMPRDLIQGAAEYLEYTSGLSDEEGMALDTTKFLEMVGIEAPDNYTVVYHCLDKFPYFDTVATAACLAPLATGFVEEVGVENVLSTGIDGLWYSGPYTLTEFIQGNTKTLTKNPLYWDTDAKLFDTVTIRIVDDANMSYQLYETGEIDHTDLSEATLRTIYDDESNEYRDQLVEKLPKHYCYQMHLNYAKNKEDGTEDKNWNMAAANEAFRLSLYYGVNLKNYYARTNFIYPLHCENETFTMPGLVYFSDGTEYTKRVEEKLGLPESDGENPRRYDADKAQQYKDQAIQELTAKGVTFPVEIDYYIKSGAQNTLDSATVLKQCFEENLGSDYVKVNIKTFVSSLSQEVLTPRLQSFTVNGWGADYGDLQNYLGQMVYGDESAYYSNNYSYANIATDETLINTYKEYTELVNKANAITGDLDARYEAYADAEVFLLQHALCIPANLDVSWQLTKINDYSKGNAMFGVQSYMYKNWETSVEAYTTEQYEEFKKEAGL